MPRPFVLPDLGEGLVEAEIVRVLVKEGEIVREDAPLLEVETDKAQVEIPSPMSGRVEKVHVAPHQTVRVGEVLVTFADREMGGPEMASPTPQRSSRPGDAGALLDLKPPRRLLGWDGDPGFGASWGIGVVGAGALQ
jgi:pyruvate/2-oxoglutarate dehydrogenase complex dihydrolipoamide acyltransferase (E2) component